MADPKDTVTLRSANACPAWLNANDGGSGYYRVRYDGAAGRKLIDNIEKLELREKVDLLTSVSALVAAGQMPASEALALVPKFKDASEPELILAALDIAQQVKRSVPPELKPDYARFMTAMFSAKARQLGFEPRQGESEDDRLLRSALIPVVAEFGDQELIAKAKELASRWLADRKSVNADVAGSALNIAAANGDEKYYERLVAELRKSTDRRDRARIVGRFGFVS